MSFITRLLGEKVDLDQEKVTTMNYSVCYEGGKQEGREEATDIWPLWLESELHKRSSTLELPDGYEIIQRGKLLEKEDITALQILVSSPQYPFLKKYFLRNAQEMFKRSGHKSDAQSYACAQLANLLIAFTQDLELVKIMQDQPTPPDAF